MGVKAGELAIKVLGRRRSYETGVERMTNK